MQVKSEFISLICGDIFFDGLILDDLPVSSKAVKGPKNVVPNDIPPVIEASLETKIEATEKWYGLICC